jgi:hypothetical protein
MEIAYSDKDIKNKLNNKARVIKYSDLYNYKTIEDALGPYKTLVILYETSDNFGHWVCVYLYNNILWFFDSYGLWPDDELTYIDPRFRIKNYEQFDYLSILLGISDYEVDYNNFQLQLEDEGINTCGRWCVARIINKDLTTDEFYEVFKNDEIGLSDEKIVDFTL